MTNNPLPTPGRLKKTGQQIKLPVLLPFFVAILIMLLTFSFAIYNLQHKNIHDDLRAKISKTDEFLQDEIDEDARFLGAISHLVKNDPRLQQLWLAGDRKKLFEYISPVAQKLRYEYGITHFYFFDVNQTCFLRVYDPANFGDRIERTTLLNAMRSGKPSWGIELGKYGNLVLRSVHPWFINNTLAGYIELGEEINHITPRLKESLNVEFVVILNKSLLNRTIWEKGRELLGHTPDWDRFPDSVIASSTIPSIPDEFTKFIGLSHGRHNDRLISAEQDSSTYLGGFARLHDAAKNEIGDILIVKNVSRDLAALNALLAIVTTLCFLIAALLGTFFYFHISGIEKRLLDTHSRLETEIEKRKQTEAEVREHRDHLENLVQIRTVELEKLNANLASTVSQLNQSNKELREFAHLSAHDLKTPLRGIGTLAQWLFEDYYDKFDDNGRQQIALLIRRVGRLDKLMDAILQYSTISRNKQYEQPSNLNILFSAALAEIKPPANIKITSNKDLPIVICEERHIYQVFYHLLNNAVKFMDKTDGRISIDCYDEDKFWRFSITDNGPGIEPQHFERIFRLFQTLNDRDDSENTGVGLTLVKKIVELYNGRIWLLSQPGQGTTFNFTLPKQPAEVDRQLLQAAAN